MTQADDPTKSRYDHTRTLIVPIEIGPEKILEVLATACEAAGEYGDGIRCFAKPEVEDGVVQDFWLFKCIYLGDISPMAHFRVMILISPDKDGLVLLITKMNMPENGLDDDSYEAYTDGVRNYVSHTLLGHEAEWLDTPDSYGLVNQSPGVIPPKKLMWTYNMI